MVLEGMDGAGKSAAATRLMKRLWRDGVPATFVDAKRPRLADPFLSTRMKTHAAILWEGGGDEPRQILCDEHWVHLSASWYHAVAQHVIEPSLDEPQVSVADGWFYKLLARFVVKRAAIAELAQASYATLVRPDVTFLLDVDPAIAASRKSSFGLSETGHFDGLSGATRSNFISYQSRVREALLEMGQRWQWTVIDASKLDVEAVVERVRGHLATHVADLKSASRP